MFDCCTKCVDKYRDLFGDVIEGISDLLSVIDQYQIGITTEAKKQIISKIPGGAADKDGMQLVMRITQSLQTLSKTLAGFGKEASSFRTNLNGLINKIQVKHGQAVELWSSGKAKMHRYYTKDSFGSSLLCCVKADRKTMRRNMLSCTPTEPDTINIELGDGKAIVGNTVTLSSLNGKVLKKHEAPIIILIPFEPPEKNRRREVVLMTRISPNDPYEEEKTCMKFTRDDLSSLMVVPVIRPVVYREVIDSKGGIIKPPTDDTVNIQIPAGAVQDKATIRIQMAKLTMKIEDSVQEDSTVRAMVCSEEGWKSETFERSLTTLGSFKMDLKPEAKRPSSAFRGNHVKMHPGIMRLVRELEQIFKTAVESKIGNVIQWFSTQRKAVFLIFKIDETQQPACNGGHRR
ncbi:hypothetical protein LSH36_2245g00004 [Paralvinella palmiformis]|uniref:Uncharacterized protein n=1 Tax=Paralvinella palmiformis TaxID=53620 RepID=A0AAD9MKR6_9ANNE|nr:hypothetical protein LSH36_2245g00004 [Paralvinella palmiformis]